MGQIPHMSLANGSDPVDSSFAAASYSNKLRSLDEDEKSTAAAQRAVARFSVQGKAALGISHLLDICFRLSLAPVTGGFGALGFESALALLEHGLTHLAICDLHTSEDKLQALRKRGSAQNIRVFAIDIASEAAVETAVRAVVDAFGRLDIVLSCAGMVHCAHSLDTSASKWREVQDVNTTGSFLVAKAAAQSMINLSSKENRPCNASIIFIASISAHHVNFPQPQAAYNVSKAGIVHLTHCLAAEWAVHGIRVNCISPGYMDTVLNEGDSLEAARNAWTARTPLGRMGRKDEIAGVVVMLCSPAGSYITGADIRVDGESPVAQ